jgi:hypothetical protein
MSSNVEKLIVAVHGIGDQTRSATIQQVLSQFTQYHGRAAAVPLGRFHSSAVFCEDDPEVPELGKLGFSEVYWADVPRKAVEDKYTLESVQSWVRTVIGRVRRNNLGTRRLTDADERMLKEVLGEMLQTVNVLEALCLLAGKMGLFSFDLKKVLVDFLGDVQVVAEFKEYGDLIGGAFSRRMQEVHSEHPGVKEIYIVAHSEGTVVALLGLLTALCCDDRPWISKVRGLMTLGSPIDKHLVLWPELFRDLQAPTLAQEKRPAIEWHNYYDYGDPVGFELDMARDRFASAPWVGIFHFPPENDHGFARYPLPGKAHNDYWQDEQVFGHFIRHVVHKEPPAGKAMKYEKPPSSKPIPRVLSWIAPYAAGLAVLFCAALVLYKAGHEFLHPGPENDPSVLATFARALGLASLLAGITVMARIPRLTRSWGWRALGALVFVASLISFKACLCWGAESSDLWACMSTVPVWPSTELIFALAAIAVVVAATVAGALLPGLGMWALLIPGVAAVAAVLYEQAQRLTGPDPASHGPLWPVFLSGALFLYLWWLAALVFDLTFVWHRYIRMAVPLFQAEKELKERKPGPWQKLQGRLREGGGRLEGRLRKAAGRFGRSEKTAA